ncbi:MAG: acyltransferase [Alphaproteobacteria bacterium]|nr:acyltransferase [Alphaproteobacteria bacterium]
MQSATARLNDNLKAVLCLIPLIAAGLFTIFRDPVAAYTSQLIGIASYGDYIYQVLRMGCYVIFALTLVALFKKSAASTSSVQSYQVTSYDPLLGLRFFAFMRVFMGHWFLVIYPSHDIGAVLRSNTPYWLLTTSPWAGVWVFFTLSGYLMAKGFINGRYMPDWHGITTFYRKRALRIFPIYYSAALIAGLMISPDIFKLSQHVSLVNFTDTVLLDSNGAMPIGALWSIATEFQFYIMVPFIYLLTRQFFTTIPRILLGIVSTAIIFLVYKLHMTVGFGLTHWHAFVYKPTLVNLDVFLFGMLTAYAVDFYRKKNVTFKYSLTIGISLLTVLYIAVSYCSAVYMVVATPEIQGVFTCIAPIVTGLTTALIIFLFEMRDTATDKKPGIIKHSLWWLTTQGGVLTYSLYVWSEPVMSSLRRTAPVMAELGKTDVIIYSLTMGCPILLIVGLFFYRMVELPFDKKRSALT